MNIWKIFNKIIIFTIATILFTTIGIFKYQTKVLASESEKYSWDNVNITGGGYIPAVIFNPSEEGLAYMRTDMGGAYRWDTDAEKWIPLMDWISPDDWNLLGCESIATDPIDPDRVYIAAGTYTNSWTKQNGCIFRSTDKGNSFEKIPLSFKLGGNMPGRSMGERLNIDPNDDSVLYLGARSGNGLWKSTDYGSNWSQVTSFPSVGNYKDTDNNIVGVTWVVFDSTSSEEGQPCQTIYVGVANSGTDKTVFCSKDGGQTWNALEGQPTYGTDIGDNAKNYMPYHAVLTSEGIMYITYSNEEGPYNGTYGGVWKYNTKTKVWSEITPQKGKPYGGISVDAENSKNIITSVLNDYKPDINIFRSVDGGDTWKPFYTNSGTRKNNYDIDYSSDSPWLDWGNKNTNSYPRLGWMVGDIKIDPFNSDHVVYGTGATLYGINNMTDFDTGSKAQINVEAKGVEETVVLDLISPSKGAPLISALGDLGGFVHEDITVSPEMITPNLTTGTTLDYAQFNQNKIVRGGYEGGMVITSDGGESWKDISQSSYGKINKIAISSDGNVIVCSSANGVYYSSDDGKSWKNVSGIGSGAKVISDKGSNCTFYAIYNNNLYKADSNMNFAKTGGILPTATMNLASVPNKEGNIWVAADGKGIYYSTDGGASFTKASGVSSANLVGFGKAISDESYMSIYIYGTVNNQKGIYRSNDKGATWVRINDDDHQYGCTPSALTGDPRIYGRVYIGTSGRGIVYGDTDKHVDQVKVETINIDKELNLNLGENKQLSTEILPENASNKEVSWKSNNEDVAIVYNDGNVSAISVGAAEITCTANDGSGINAICNVNVAENVTTDVAVKVESISLDNNDLNLEVGKEQQLKATVLPENATIKNVVWKSNNEDIATVDQNGKVKAISEGKAEISCIATDGSKIVTKCEVTVVVIKDDPTPVHHGGGGGGGGGSSSGESKALTWTGVRDVTNDAGEIVRYEANISYYCIVGKDILEKVKLNPQSVLCLNGEDYSWQIKASDIIKTDASFNANVIITKQEDNTTKVSFTKEDIPGVSTITLKTDMANGQIAYIYKVNSDGSLEISTPNVKVVNSKLSFNILSGGDYIISNKIIEKAKGSFIIDNIDGSKTQIIDGKKAVGFIKIDGNMYYFDNLGVMKTGWINSDNKWYYANNLGVIQTGWFKDNNVWYLLDETGIMKTGWNKENEKWYYLNNSGVMKTGWVQDNGKWYYLDNSGVMKIGWIEDNKNWYYLKQSGDMALNETINGYTLAENGAMI